MNDSDHVAGLAREFLATVVDDRAPWASAFASWAAGHQLATTEARAVKVEVLRERVFSAVERSAARGQRRRRG